MKILCTLAFATLLNVSGFAQDSKKDVNDAFLAMLNGTEEAAQEAIETFGSAAVQENGMIPFGSSPKVTKTEGNCTFFTLTDEDDEKNEYYICSEKGKIIEFDWADMLDDEDE